MTYRFLLLLLVASHWPVWVWYGKRMTDGSDEPWGVLALASSLCFIPWKRCSEKVPNTVILFVLFSLMVFQLVFVHWVPLLRALFAVGMIAVVLIFMRSPIGIFGMLCLSLPWIATLQFYIGYPLRVLIGEVTRWMLLASGYGVEREGVNLLWLGHRVVIDRPCAGIYMLWFGAYFTYLLACVYKLNFRPCLQIGIGSFVLILSANIVRNFALFFIETEQIKLPGFAHELVGVIVFLLVVLALVKITESKVPGRALRSAD
jgi:exosortase/archaeosortase family protein